MLFIMYCIDSSWSSENSTMTFVNLWMHCEIFICVHVRKIFTVNCSQCSKSELKIINLKFLKKQHKLHAEIELFENYCISQIIVTSIFNLNSKFLINKLLQVDLYTEIKVHKSEHNVKFNFYSNKFISCFM